MKFRTNTLQVACIFMALFFPFYSAAQSSATLEKVPNQKFNSKVSSEELKKITSQLTDAIATAQRDNRNPLEQSNVQHLLTQLRTLYGEQVASEVMKAAGAKLPPVSHESLNQALEDARKQQAAYAGIIDKTVKKQESINFTPAPWKNPGPIVSSIAMKDAVASTQAQPAAEAGQLYIFASFGLPEAILDKLVAHAITWRGILVLRGFIDNDAKKSQLIASRYIGMPNFQMNIDPPMFKKYQVERVPTYLIEAPGEINKVRCHTEGICSPEREYISIEGDIDPKFAFDKMRDASPAWQKRIEKYVAKFSTN